MSPSFGSVHVWVNPIDRHMFLNITASGFNNNNPFQVRIDNQHHSLLNANLYNESDDTDAADLINLVSTDQLIPIHGSFIRYPLACAHGGTFGIGAGSHFVLNYGPIDIITVPNSLDRTLIVESNDLSTFMASCFEGSYFNVPITRFRDLWHTVGFNCRFSLRYPNDRAVPSSSAVNSATEPVSLTGRVGYMSIPRGSGIEIGLMLTHIGAIPVAGGYNRFANCGDEQIAELPEILIYFVDNEGHVLGQLIQSPTDYNILNHEEYFCELRFDVLMGDGPYAMDPMALTGVNMRLEDNQISFCDPLLS